jgi:hypothetical protein
MLAIVQTKEAIHSPEDKRIILGLVPTLFEPEEEMFGLGDIKIPRVLLDIGIAEGGFNDS